MAYPQIGSVPGKVPSYAKIAATPAPNPAIGSNVRKGVKASATDSITKPQSLKTEQQNLPQKPAQVLQEKSQTQLTDLPSISLQNLSLDDRPNGHTPSEPNADSADSYEEDQSQISSSSFNKPQSFDTKSLASVTTFAMDDKESIRPDDSASVRAVDDEHPHPALSRHSSFQHDTDTANPRAMRLNPSVTIPGRRFPTLANPPRFGNLPISPVLESQDVHLPKSPIQVVSPDDPRDATTIANMPPDEKLMDALASAKDRLPLLQLEEKILYFVTNSSTEVLDLPPQNSFTRLLTHKLADYYNLAHQVTEDNTSVRVFRSGFLTLPTPLAQLAKVVPVGSVLAPNAAAMKIMRRDVGARQFSAGNSSAPSSSVPSKATSENGVEGTSDDCLTSPTESTPGRDKSKLTREEREAQYKAVRERIFGDFQEPLVGEVVSTGENSASMSRSSSSSGKKNKKGRKQPRDDGFEARSAYVASYTPVQGTYNGPYMDASVNHSYPILPISYEPNMYGATPTQSYPGFDTSMQYLNQNFSQPIMPAFSPNDWQAMQAVQMQNNYFMYNQVMQFQQQPNGMFANGQTMPAQAPEWYPGQNQPYVPAPQMSPNAGYVPQPMMDQRTATPSDKFGHHLGRTYSNPAPHSGYLGHTGAKSLFNPQTRSFVPNNNEGRPGRGSRFKNPSRNSIHVGAGNASPYNGGMVRNEDSLKKYGTPPSLPKKPPPAEAKHVVAEVAHVPNQAQENGAVNASAPLIVNGATKPMK